MKPAFKAYNAMIYNMNITLKTAKLADYLGNAGSDGVFSP